MNIKTNYDIIHFNVKKYYLCQKEKKKRFDHIK